MAAIALALLASAAWGTADFLAGERSRVHALVTVLLLSQAAGMVALGLVVAVRAEPPPGGGFLVAPALGGLAGAVGVAALYRGLAIGPMGVVAPISALSTVVPISAGLLQGERPSAWQGVGIVVAVVGVILASRAPSRGRGARVAPTAVLLGLVAAAGFGGGAVALDAASEYDVLWGTLALRTILFALVVGAAVATRPRLGIGSTQTAALAGIGVLDTAANVAFAEATTRGLLSVVGVLGQLYPVVVVLLARFSLDERLAPNQLAGVVLALAGVGVIAAA